MNATYRITFDEIYCLTLVERYQQQRRFWVRPQVQILAYPAVVGGILLVEYIVTPDLRRLLPWMFGIVVALTVFAWFYLRKVPLRRLLRRTGRTVEYVLSDEGVRVDESLGRANLKWPIYPRAVRFPDGLMLLRPGVVCWLPDSSLSGATPADVTALVQSRTPLRHVA